MQAPRRTSSNMLPAPSSVQGVPEKRTSFTKAFQFLRQQSCKSSKPTTRTTAKLISDTSEVFVYSSSLKGQQQPLQNVSRRSILSSFVQSNIKSQNDEGSLKSQEDASMTDVTDKSQQSRKISFNPNVLIYISKHTPMTDSEKQQMFFCPTDYQRMIVDALRCVAEERTLVENNLSDKLEKNESVSLRGLESVMAGNRGKSTEQKQAIRRAVLNEQIRQRQYRVSDTANIAKLAMQVSRFDVRKAIETGQTDAEEIFDYYDTNKNDTKEMYKAKRRRSPLNGRSAGSNLALHNDSIYDLSISSHRMFTVDISQKCRTKIYAHDATEETVHPGTSCSTLPDESRDCNGKLCTDPKLTIEERMEI